MNSEKEVGKRLKQIRRELQLTQAAFGAELGLGRSTVDFETGRTKLSGYLVKELAKRYNINPLWLFGESAEKKLLANGQEKNPKVITLDSNGNENIALVSVKAAAGYCDNLNEVDHYADAPTFHIPLPEYSHATFRGFQVSGDSMVPHFFPGEWVMGRAVSNLEEVKNGKAYIIVEYDSIRIKNLWRTEEKGLWRLESVNSSYPDVSLSMNDVQEIWECHSKLSILNQHADQFAVTEKK